MAFQIAKEVREVGNKLFKEGKIEEALAKYQSKASFTFNCDAYIETVLQESIRYLDVHPTLPEDVKPELKESWNALLIPLLLNSALAAIRTEPISAQNAGIALGSTSRVLNRLNPSPADSGKLESYLLCMCHLKLNHCTV